mgnify:CR=1 FL=1
MKSPASLRKPVLASLVVALGAALVPAQAVAADEAQWLPGRLLVTPRAGIAAAEFDKIIKKQGGKQVGKIADGVVIQSVTTQTCDCCRVESAGLVSCDAVRDFRA